MTLVFQIAAGILVALIVWNYLSVLLWIAALIAILYVLYWTGVWIVAEIRGWLSPAPDDPERAAELDDIRRKVEEISRE